MEPFLRFFAEKKFFASMMLALVCVLGVMALFHLRLQEYPASAQGETSITTHYPGASAHEIELEITNRLEKELKTVQGLKYFESSSSDGLSVIDIRIRDGENLQTVNQDIREAIDRVTDLPADLDQAPLVEAENLAMFEILTFGVAGEMPFPELREYARQLEKQIRSIPGVGKIETAALPNREFIVAIDPTRLDRYAITAFDVVDAIAKRNISTSGGQVTAWQQDRNLVTLSQVQSPDELAETIIKVLSGGALVRLADVARVYDGFERETERVTMNGLPAIGFTVFKTEAGDIMESVAAIRTLLKAEERRSHGQLSFPVTLDLSEEVGNRFSVVGTNGLIGMVLVLAVLALCVQRRLAPWIATSLPFCVFGTLFALLVFGFSLDSITLSAIMLVIGIIVDDSIVVSESIDQQYRQGLPPVQAAVQGYREVFRPLMASLLTTLLVFLPMLFIPGDMGSAYVVMPLTIIMALFFSLVDVSLLLPAHLASALSRVRQSSSSDGSHWFDVLRERYQQLLTKVLRYRYPVVGLAVVLLVATFFMSYRWLKVDFFPTEAARYIELSLEVADGTTLDDAWRVGKELEALIAAVPEVERYHIQHQSPESTGLIILSPSEDRTLSADEIAESLEEAARALPLATHVQFKVDGGGPPPGDPIDFRVFGSSDAHRVAMAQDLKAWLSDQPGVLEVELGDDNRRPQLQVVPDYDWLARLQLSVETLTRTMALAFEGEEASTSWIGDEEVKLRVWLDTPFRQQNYLRDLDIPLNDGRQVPLKQVATIQSVEAPREITHWNGDRSSLVTGDIDDDRQNANMLSSNTLAYYETLTERYPGIRVEAGGEAEQTAEAMGGLISAFAVAMLVIWVVVALLFGSLVQPLLVMAVIPFAIGSALLALILHNAPMSFLGGIGILGLCGVVVNNALVMVDRINRLRTGANRVEQALVQAAGSRLRPILLTTITTVAGLLPLAYGLGGSDVYMGPMALTLGYGLLFTMPVVLFVLPCCYRVGADVAEHVYR